MAPLNPPREEENTQTTYAFQFSSNLAKKENPPKDRKKIEKQIPKSLHATAMSEHSAVQMHTPATS